MAIFILALLLISMCPIYAADSGYRVEITYNTGGEATVTIPEDAVQEDHRDADGRGYCILKTRTMVTVSFFPYSGYEVSKLSINGQTYNGVSGTPQPMQWPIDKDTVFTVEFSSVTQKPTSGQTQDTPKNPPQSQPSTATPSSPENTGKPATPATKPEQSAPPVTGVTTPEPDKSTQAPSGDTSQDIAQEQAGQNATEDPAPDESDEQSDIPESSRQPSADTQQTSDVDNKLEENILNGGVGAFVENETTTTQQRGGIQIVPAILIAAVTGAIAVFIILRKKD